MFAKAETQTESRQSDDQGRFQQMSILSLIATLAACYTARREQIGALGPFERTLSPWIGEPSREHGGFRST